MDQSDIDKYLVAKRQHTLASTTVVVTGTLLVAAALLWIFGLSDRIVVSLVVISAIGTQFATSTVTASRQVLVSIVENQINRDPDALAYLARRTDS